MKNKVGGASRPPKPPARMAHSPRRAGGLGGRLCPPTFLLLLCAAAPAPPPSAILDKLKLAHSPQEATALEAMLESTLYNQATASVQLLLDGALAAIHADKPKDALADADAAVTLQPDLAELWRRRAQARFLNGDDKGAFVDLAQALAREPRLITAWADLSRFAEARKDYKRALQAWQKLLELDPQTEGGKKRLDLLQRKANGQPI